MKWRWAEIVLATLVGAGIVGAGVMLAGAYDVSAVDNHLPPTFHALDFAMKRSVKVRTGGIKVPPLDDAALISRGRALYAEHCAQCHGAPGVAPEPFALGMTPAAANLAHTAKEWEPAALYWVVKNGLKMTGMPAWEYRMPDGDLWAVVAFLEKLPALSPADYAAMKGSAEPKAEPASGAPDPRRGQFAIQQYACVTCHAIPGIVGANSPVGPPLDRLGARAIIGGHLPNNRENLEAFLRFPQKYKPGGAMPDLGVTERDARDIAAYLLSLR